LHSFGTAGEIVEGYGKKGASFDGG